MPSYRHARLDKDPAVRASRITTIHPLRRNALDDLSSTELRHASVNVNEVRR